MLIISAEIVWRLCEVEDAPEGGHPRLKVSNLCAFEIG